MAYIDREIAISAMEQVKKEHSFLPRICIKAIDVAINAFKIVPTADVVEVKHGEWFLLDECANEGVYCSVCYKKVYRTEYANQKIKSNYCPNCGAKMDGQKK